MHREVAVTEVVVPEARAGQERVVAMGDVRVKVSAEMATVVAMATATAVAMATATAVAMATATAAASSVKVAATEVADPATVAGAVMVAVEKEVAESGPARETPPPPRLLSSRWRWSPALR